MSFPRAKLQRFNETPSCSPAPGTYDPKLEMKVKAPTMRKDGKQGSEGDLHGIIKPSVAVTPTFRTPQLPRKVIKNVVKSQGRERCESSSSVDDLLRTKFSDLSELDGLKQRLKDTVLELNKSKDLCEMLNGNIAEKMNQIEKLQCKNETLAVEIETLQNELNKAQSEHQQSLTKFEAIDRDMIVNLQELHCMVDELNDRKDTGCKQMLNLREELDNLACLKLDLEQKVAQKQQMILLLQSELSNAEVELVECRSECERMNVAASERTQEVETLKVTIGNLENKVEEIDKQLRHMRDNLMNGSVVRENLEEQLNEKEAAYMVLQESHDRLSSECECLKEQHSKEIEQILSSCDQQLSYIVNNFELASELVRTNTFNLQEICSEKLLLLEEKVSVVSQTEKHWQKEIVHLKEELERAASELKEEQFMANERITSLISEITRKELESSKRIKDVESEARIITEKLLRAEEELKKVADIRDELKISDVENKITIVELQDTIDMLAVERDSVNAALSTSTEECNTLKLQNKKLTVGNRNLNDSLEALRVRLLESESDVEEMTRLKCALESDKRDLELALHSKMLELEEQKRNIAEMETDNLQQIEKIREHLLEKLESFKQKALESSVELQRFEAEKHVQIQSLSSQLEIFHQDFEELNKYVAAMEDENEKQAQQLEAFQTQQVQLEESFASLNSRFDHQSQELKQCTCELSAAQGKIASQEEEILEYKCHIEQLTVDVESSEARVVELNEALGVLEESNAEHEKEIEALTEKLDHQRDCAKVATQQIANLEAARTYQEHQIQTLSSELERHKEFSHQATDHVLTLVSSSNEKDLQIEALTEEIEELKNSVNKTNVELEELKTELISEQKKLKDSMEEVELLEGDRFVKEEQLKELSVEIEHQQECNRKYYQQITALEKQKVEIEEQLSNEKLKIVSLEKENTTLEQTSKLSSVILDETKKNSSAHEENIMKELSDSKEQITSLLSVKNELELEIHEINRKCDILQNSVTQERKVVAELRNEIAQFEENTSGQENMPDLGQTCEKYQNQIQVLRAEITNFTLRLREEQSSAQNTIATLKKELESYRLQSSQITTLEGESAEWQKRFQEIESLVGPFKEQLEAYRAECKTLEAQKGEVQDNLRELAHQYAANLGHQNTKQKIRHVHKIIDQNLALKEEVRNLKRTVEKLRRNGATPSGKSSNTTLLPLVNKDKENMRHNNSPVRKSPTASPNTKPFADRSAQKNVL